LQSRGVMMEVRSDNNNISNYRYFHTDRSTFIKNKRWKKNEKPFVNAIGKRVTTLRVSNISGVRSRNGVKNSRSGHGSKVETRFQFCVCPQYGRRCTGSVVLP